MFRVLALAAVVAFAPIGGSVLPVVAVAAPPAGSPQADLAAVARYAAVQQKVLTDLSGMLTVTISGMQQAILYGVQPSKREESRAWFAAWETDLRARIADIKDWKRGLPPLPRAEINRLTPELMPMYERIPARVDNMVALMVDFVERVIPLTANAAAGDQAAGSVLASEFFRGASLLLNAENEMLELGSSGLQKGNPSKPLSASILASNQAVMLYLQYMEATARGQEVDRAKLAAGIREKGATAAAQARAIITDARAARAQFNGQSFEGKDRLMQALTTFEESAAVELEVAATVTALADPVERGVLVTGEAQARLDAIQPLINRRLSIHQRRLTLLQPS